MKMKTKPNDCAFPANQEDREIGMTIREYFAAKAMNGILASIVHESDNRHYVNGPNLDVHLIAENSVEMADALIAALQ